MTENCLKVTNKGQRIFYFKAKVSGRKFLKMTDRSRKGKVKQSETTEY